MCRRIPQVFAVALLLALRHSVAMSSGSLTERWTEMVRAKKWVTAFTDTSRPERIPAPVDLIVVKIGGEEQVVYRVQPHDVEIGGPIVSPDGTKLAFVKVEKVNGQVYKKIYTMDIDGSSLRELVELTPPRHPIKGAQIGPSPLAWSYDNKKIVFVGTLKATRPEEPRQQKFGVWGPTKLMMVDTTSGETVELVQEVGQRIEGVTHFRPIITSQAWSPDNRRLVYADGDSRVIMLDTATRGKKDLGEGIEPTWSPDGRFIAVQMPHERKVRRYGDYMLISAEPSHERTLLLSNSRTLFSFWSLGYASEAIWFPDSQFLMAYHYPGERGYPYVLDRTTGEVTKLPPRFWGWSWGGKP